MCPKVAPKLIDRLKKAQKRLKIAKKLSLKSLIGPKIRPIIWYTKLA